MDEGARAWNVPLLTYVIGGLMQTDLQVFDTVYTTLSQVMCTFTGQLGFLWRNPCMYVQKHFAYNEDLLSAWKKLIFNFVFVLWLEEK